MWIEVGAAETKVQALGGSAEQIIEDGNLLLVKIDVNKVYACHV